MVNFSEIVAFFSGNGFTDVEAIQISSKVAGLADANKMWIEGVAFHLIKDGDFSDFEPQNEWQDEVVRDLSDGLSALERQCYFLHEIQGQKPAVIQKVLKINVNVYWRALRVARYKVIANKKFEVTEDMLNQLPSRMRNCFDLYWHSKANYYQISKKLGVHKGSVRESVQSAKWKLYKLSKEGEAS